MKKERKTHKRITSLYYLLDLDDEDFSNNNLDENKFKEANSSFAKLLCMRKSPWEYKEYYGIFELQNKRIGVDPKRFSKKLSRLSPEIMKVMGKRRTTLFHPKVAHFNDYLINEVKLEIESIRNEFNETYKPFYDKAVQEIKAMKVGPIDYEPFMLGYSGPNSARMWAEFQNMKNEMECERKKIILFNSLYAQFYLQMGSKIECLSNLIYARCNCKPKKWSRDLLYDNVNYKKIDNRKLKHYDYHNKFYLVFNFLKHNNESTFNNLKEKYPNILIDSEYMPGTLGIYYIKDLGEKMILDYLDGVGKYLIEWCEANCNESEFESSWNYDDYFLEKYNDEIELFENPLGLSPFDDGD